MVFTIFAIIACGKEDKSETTEPTSTNSTFSLSSVAIENGILLDAFRCESKDSNGVEASIPLSWTNIPDGTGSLAVIMHHYPHQTDTTTVNSYLLLWAIDPSISSIAHGAADDGPFFMGANKDGNHISYTSPCAPAGTGSHAYTITLYALNETPSTLPTESSATVDYDVLKSAISTVTILGKAELNFDDVAP